VVIFARPSCYFYLKNCSASRYVVRVACFGRHRRVGPKASAHLQHSGKHRITPSGWPSRVRTSRLGVFRVTLVEGDVDTLKALGAWASACPA